VRECVRACVCVLGGAVCRQKDHQQCHELNYVPPKFLCWSIIPSTSERDCETIFQVK
jgi:hypothetical protein